ncbi:hypothetical protein, partial [Streptomyces sp. NPDC058476]|uniref:hypothetical protein n=1 Tax=Streptomyces sp. NPDC058476 TaxID=3346519 RepID=UPI00365B9914
MAENLSPQRSGTEVSVLVRYRVPLGAAEFGVVELALLLSGLAERVQALAVRAHRPFHEAAEVTGLPGTGGVAQDLLDAAFPRGEVPQGVCDELTDVVPVVPALRSQPWL